jgi:hypothetical protein
MGRLSVRQIERLIYPVSFYRHKAKHVKATLHACVAFRRAVPTTMEEPLTLPGVGRKTANLVSRSRASRTSASTRVPAFRIVSAGCGRTPLTKRSRRSIGRRPAAGGRTSTCISSRGAERVPAGLSAVRRARSSRTSASGVTVTAKR